MRILAIRGQNLASLKGPFEIDLVAPPLGGLGLFAIAGPVGAGKSTVLDAMCVALFARTPRLSGRGGAPLGDERDGLKSNDARTLARRACVLAFAEVDFRGVDGRIWRARWQVRRARGQAFGRLLDDEQTLIDVESGRAHGTTHVEVRAAIVHKLGLSYEEFTRSVVLSQGGFAAFLQAKPEERAALLEKITGTEIYGELSMRAFSRAKEANTELAALRDERARVQPLAPEARVHASAQASGAGAQREQHEQRVAQLVVLAARAAERDQRARAQADAHAALASAEQMLAIAEQEARDAEAERARSAPLLEEARHLVGARGALDLDTLAARAADATLARDQCARQRDTAQQELARAGKSRAEAARVCDDGAPLLALMPQLDVVVRDLDVLARHATDREGARAILDAKTRSTAEAAEEERAAGERVARAQHVVDALRGSLPEALRDAPVRLARAAVAHAQASSAQRLIDELTIELRVEERALARIGHAAERAALVDGEPCPLCGALDHPYAREHEAVSVAAQRRAVEALRARLDDGRKQASDARARADNWRQQDELPALEEREAPALSLLASTLAQLAAAQTALEAACTEHVEQQRVHAELRSQQTFHLREVERLDGEERALRERLAPMLAPCGISLDERQPRAAARELRARAMSLKEAQARVAALAAAVVDNERQVQTCERDFAVIEATWRQHQATHDDAARRAVDIDARLRSLFGGRDVVVVADQIERRRAHTEAALASARARVAAAREALARSVEELARVAEAGERDEVERALGSARAQLLDASEHEARLRAALAEDDRLLARARELDDALAHRENAARTWSELGELIGSHDGARFRSFAQGLTLDTLVFFANEHLKALAPRYLLERAPSRAGRVDPTLCVVDRDAGDERRAVQSLSGGETFLVALALALGLASLSSSRARVESLFIDEGFSSLDPEALEVALAAFEALRDGGRQIGVISHVPALAERIGSQVRVLPLGEGRSRVEVRA